ncbi:unnamed protein product [Amaranthus hypochondriacus]
MLWVSTDGAAGVPFATTDYKEYRLQDYSSWFKNRFHNTKHWNHLKTCLFKTQVCSKFQAKFSGDTKDQFFSNKFSSVESGCCKPSNDCNFNYTNPTEWTKPEDYSNTNADCYKWGNDKDVLCFNCQSCKAGLADDVKRKWNKSGIICIVFVILLISSSFLACLAIDDHF